LLRAGKAKNKLVATEDHPSAGALFMDFLEFVRFANPAIAIIEIRLPACDPYLPVNRH